MCPVCDGQTLDESQSELSRQMRQVLRERLAAGDTDQQVKDYFSDPGRYGLAVLAAPPPSGFNVVLWVLPGALAVAGAAGVIFLVRSTRRRASAVAVPADSGQALTPYLRKVDEELGLEPAARTVRPAAPPRQTGDG